MIIYDDELFLFSEWLTLERRLALFPAGTIVRDSDNRKSFTRREQNLNSGFRELSCAVVIITTPRCHMHLSYTLKTLDKILTGLLYFLYTGKTSADFKSEGKPELWMQMCLCPCASVLKILRVTLHTSEVFWYAFCLWKLSGWFLIKRSFVVKYVKLVSCFLTFHFGFNDYSKTYSCIGLELSRCFADSCKLVTIFHKWVFTGVMLNSNKAIKNACSRSKVSQSINSTSRRNDKGINTYFTKVRKYLVVWSRENAFKSFKKEIFAEYLRRSRGQQNLLW